MKASDLTNRRVQRIIKTSRDSGNSGNKNESVWDEIAALGSQGAVKGTSGAAVLPFLESNPFLKDDTKPILREAFKKSNPDVVLNESMSVNPARSRYNPFTNKITAGTDSSAGVLAHEMGHAASMSKGGKAARLGRGGLQVASKPAMLLSPFVSALSQDKDTARTGALIGTGASIPVLAEELLASNKGGNMLRKLTNKGKLGAFIGLPTYAAAAVAPGLTYKVKDWLGGYDRPEKK